MNSDTGEETGVSVSQFNGLSVMESAVRASSLFAGDCLIIVRKLEEFAIVCPAFSEHNTFYSVKNNEVFLWSHLGLPDDICISQTDFNIEFLSGVILHPSWRTPLTGLAEINELLSGAILYSDGNNLRQIDMLSSAVVSLNYNTNLSYSEVVNDVHNLINKSVMHKTKHHEGRFSIACSGGLDSSIVTVAASNLYPSYKIPLLHSYKEGLPQSDEKQYFALVADHIGGEKYYVECSTFQSKDNLSSQYLDKSPRPTKMAAAIGINYSIQKQAASHGSTMLLGGDGGDQLFLKTDNQAISTEIISELNSITELPGIINYLATKQGVTSWEIIKEIFSKTKERQWLKYLYGDVNLANDSLVPKFNTQQFSMMPQLDKLSTLSASRTFQFIGMRNAELNKISLKGLKLRQRQIFIFWPLIKKALEVKRSHHRQIGVDRSISRDAFKAMLPKEIYERIKKTPGEDIHSKYNYQALLEQVIKGPVCIRGILNPQSLLNLKNSEMHLHTKYKLVQVAAVNSWMEMHEN